MTAPIGSADEAKLRRLLTAIAKAERPSLSPESRHHLAQARREVLDRLQVIDERRERSAA